MRQSQSPSHLGGQKYHILEIFESAYKIQKTKKMRMLPQFST